MYITMNPVIFITVKSCDKNERQERKRISSAGTDCESMTSRRYKLKKRLNYS